MKWFKNGAIGAAAIIGCAACTETWDDHYNQTGSTTATQTLWEQISSNSSTSQFAQILQRVKTSKNSETQNTQTYAELLSSDRTFTIWAPKNGTFNADSINALLDAGFNYDVEQSFVTNYLASFNHPASGVVDEDLTMYNSKVSPFVGSGSNYTLKGVALDYANSNKGATNGTLHTLNGQLSYRPNLYEYMKLTSGLDSLYNFFKSNETRTFSESASTQGPTVNGHPTYVDSVFYTTSLVESELYYHPSREDSLYAAVMPTNAAWIAATARLEPLFHYRDKYQQATTTYDEAGNATTTTVTYNVNVDSLRNMMVGKAILRGANFNARWQNGYQVPDYTNTARVDSLMATTYFDGTHFTLYNNDPVKGVNDASAPFDNQTPVEVSNGYAFVVNNWNYRLNKVGYWDMINNSVVETKLGTSDMQRVNSSLQNPDVTGEIPEKRYWDITPSNASANPTASFALYGVLSGTYDIYAVVVPANITNTGLTSVKPNLFRATLNYYDNDTRATSTSTSSVTTGNYVRDESSIVSGATSGSGTVRALDAEGNPIASPTPTNPPLVTNKVDSVLLFRDFKFPVAYSYAGGALQNVYPTLELRSSVSVAGRNYYDREMRICCILLVAKEE